MTDPIVEEVRTHRMAHTLKFRKNLAAICADLRAIQATSGHAVVRLPPRRPEAVQAATKQPASRRK